MEEQPLLREHSQALWPPSGPLPPILPSLHNGARPPHGSWSPPLPMEIAQIVQRFPATWTPAERTLLFEWIADKLQPVLIRFAFGALRSVNPRATSEDADEVVAETRQDAWRNLDTFDPTRGPFLPWLFTKLWQHGRRHGVKLALHQRRVVLLEDEHSASPGALRDWPDASAHTPARQVLILAVRQCIDRLPERYRDTVQRFYGLLPYTQPMSLKEIAAAQHIQPNNAKQRLHKARQLLKALLKDEEPPTATPKENA